MKTNEHLNQLLKSDPDFLDRLVNENEAAELLGYTARALQGWRLRGGGPEFVRVSARSIRYRRRDLLAWADDRVCRNTSQKTPAERSAK